MVSMRPHGQEALLVALTFALSLLALFAHGRAFAQPLGQPPGHLPVVLPTGEAIGLDQPIDAAGTSIAEPRRFHGLAHYLNGLRYFRITADGIAELRDGEAATLGADEWFAAVGRFNVLAIRSAGTGIAVAERSIRLEAPSGAPEVAGVVVSKPLLRELDPVLDRLRYAHLWRPLAALSKGAEAVLVFLERTTGAGWAIALILFAILVKLVLLPVSLATTRFQREVSAHRAALAPVLASIKKAHDGEEAHNRIMAAHKARGITPFYTLKPMLGLFILLPVLIAIFNALAEMPQFAGAGFLWIRDLAYPDDIFGLPGTVPFIGRTFNLLPWLMALVSVAASLRFRDVHASPAELSRKRRGLLLMAAAFLLLFYPFPAAMVLYWLLNNLLQAVQQELWK